MALVAAGVSVSACSHTKSRATSPPMPPSNHTTTTLVNLVPDALFQAGGDAHGRAAGVTAWGAARLSLVSQPVAVGGQAQEIDVPPGQTGGLYLQFPAHPQTAYTQSAYLDVEALSARASVDLILEWYDSSLRLLSYQLDPINVLDHSYRSHVQSARSPSGTAIVRFVVNVRGGGRVLVNGPQLQTGSAGRPLPT